MHRMHCHNPVGYIQGTLTEKGQSGAPNLSKGVGLRLSHCHVSCKLLLDRVWQDRAASTRITAADKTR